MKLGRPTKYKPEYCDRIIELAAQGMGRCEIAVELGTTRNTLTDWGEQNPEFLRALTRAREVSQAWWERLGREGITAERFNANAYSLQVRNRFPDDWRDRREHTGADGGPLEISWKAPE